MSLSHGDGITIVLDDGNHAEFWDPEPDELHTIKGSILINTNMPEELLMSTSVVLKHKFPLSPLKSAEGQPDRRIVNRATLNPRTPSYISNSITTTNQEHPAPDCLLDLQLTDKHLTHAARRDQRVYSIDFELIIPTELLKDIGSGEVTRTFIFSTKNRYAYQKDSISIGLREESLSVELTATVLDFERRFLLG